MTTRARKKKPTTEAAPFSFSSGRASFADKDALVVQQITFTMTGIELDLGGGFRPGENRWKAAITRDDTGAPEIISLSCNDRRDAQLRDAKAHIEANGPIPNVRPVKHGNAFYFRPAEPRGS
jgi:hypothetical protein